MSTALDIVRRALRSMGALRRGKEPTGADQADGLERLQSLILAMPGLIQNGRWCERAKSAAYTAKEGERITVTGAVTITLPLTVTDCETGCTRPPKDLARVYVLGADAVVDYSGDEDGAAGLWVYSATLGAWARADGLTIDDDMPFGAEDDEGLAAQLAVNMVDEYGGGISARTAALAQNSARSFRARLKKAEPKDYSRPDDSFDTYRQWRDYA